MSTIRIQALPKFPASVEAGTGIVITRSNGVLTFSVDTGIIPSLDAELLALAGLTSAANKGIQFTGAGTAGTYDLTSFAKTVLDDASAGAALTTLGFSTFTKTIIDDADATSVLTTLGVSAFAKTIIDDADASSVLTTLGVSTFAKTIIDDTSASAVRTTIGAAASGANTDITSLAGTTTNDDAAALKIGEYNSANVAIGSESSLTTATAKTLTSVTLLAGDWDVSAEVYILGAATTNFTNLIGGLSVTTNTLETTAGRFAQRFEATGFVPGSSGRNSLTIPLNRFSVGGSTVVYLVAMAQFTVDTAGAAGIIRARRVR